MAEARDPIPKFDTHTFPAWIACPKCGLTASVDHRILVAHFEQKKKKIECKMRILLRLVGPAGRTNFGALHAHRRICSYRGLADLFEVTVNAEANTEVDFAQFGVPQGARITRAVAAGVRAFANRDATDGFLKDAATYAHQLKVLAAT